MAEATVLENVLKRDRAIIAASLAAVTAAAWAYIVHIARGMQHMEMAMAMPRMQGWSALDLLLLFIMWAVMMMAMMIPSAAPMILMFASIERRRRHRAHPAASTAVFVLGYLIVWSGFSALATGAQWALHSAALLSPMMVSTSPVLGGALLVAAGVYQWMPLKQACLTQCRSPLGFLTTEWREGTRGTLVMGMRHGAFCLGCCWLLMALLFAAGVMNLLWVVAIAGFVLIEKLAPRGQWMSRAAGLVLVGWGAWMTVGGL